MKRTYEIRIETDHPDGDTQVRAAARLVAEQVGWGDNAEIMAVRIHDQGAPEHLASWIMEPGDDLTDDDLADLGITPTVPERSPSPAGEEITGGRR